MQSALLGLTLAVAATSATAGSFTLSNDRAAFEAAIGEPYLVETFGLAYAFPISSGVLDATTNTATDFGGPIVPGRILPGVTYSTPGGSGYLLNLDSGAGYDGAFLDGFYADLPDRRLTITFHTPTAVFGFDTSEIAPALEVTIHFTDGTSQSMATTVGGFTFFGFASTDGARIASAQVGGSGNSVFAFAVDNVTYAGAVPEPATWGLLATGLLAVGGLARRRR